MSAAVESVRAWDLRHGDVVQVGDDWLSVKIVGSYVDSVGERVVLCDGGKFTAGPDLEVHVRRSSTPHVTTLPKIREALNLRARLGELVPDGGMNGRVPCDKEQALIGDLERAERLKDRHAGHVFEVEYAMALHALERFREARLIQHQRGV